MHGLHMLFQVVESREESQTEMALERLFSGVLSDMPGQVLVSGELHLAVSVAIASECFAAGGGGMSLLPQ